MSVKNIEVQLKKLGMKNDVVGLEAFVTSVEDDKVIHTHTRLCPLRYMGYMICMV